MKESITVFFFTNNNHLSNVRTLQSIYRQDYPYINLIVCNDAGYGFQSERLLGNFEAGRGTNIEYVYFQENPHPMGECDSQTQLWDRINSEYYYVIHSGDMLELPSALRLCINNLRLDRSLAATVTGLREKNVAFKEVLSEITITQDPEAQGVFSRDNSDHLSPHRVRDCMMVYRMRALKELAAQGLDNTQYLSKQALPALLKQGHRIMIRPMALCCYSEDSIRDMPQEAPNELGRSTLNHIQQLLQEKAAGEANPENMLFQSQVPPTPKPARNIHRVLYKLSSFKKIAAYAAAAVLLAIAAGLFLLMKELVFFCLGLGFLLLGGFAGSWTVAMLICNLYYKKNPQRLVSQ